MFRGASSVNLDAKGRMGIPSRFRDVLSKRCDGRLVLTVNHTREQCLWLYPLDEWDNVERQVASLPSFDPTAQELKRFLIGYATDCELDSIGRVRVSPLLREFAGLKKRVVLIGQRNKFEIDFFQPATFVEDINNIFKEMALIFQIIDALKLGQKTGL